MQTFCQLEGLRNSGESLQQGNYFAMSTTDSEDLETEIRVIPPADNEPVQNYSEMQQQIAKQDEEEEEITGPEMMDCIFPFIDLETAGNGHEDWEIFNILCGVPTNRCTFQVSFDGEDFVYSLAGTESIFLLVTLFGQ